MLLLRFFFDFYSALGKQRQILDNSVLAYGHVSVRVEKKHEYVLESVSLLIKNRFRQTPFPY